MRERKLCLRAREEALRAEKENLGAYEAMLVAREEALREGKEQSLKAREQMLAQREKAMQQREEAAQEAARARVAPQRVELDRGAPRANVGGSEHMATRAAASGAAPCCRSDGEAHRSGQALRQPCSPTASDAMESQAKAASSRPNATQAPALAPPVQPHQTGHPQKTMDTAQEPLDVVVADIPSDAAAFGAFLSHDWGTDEVRPCRSLS